MLSSTELKLNLQFHEIAYNSSGGDLRIALLHSKASILEVCGWVEEVMDDIVLCSANRCCLPPERISQIKSNYIKPTYGFDYKRHFEKMLSAVVGFVVLEKVENQVGVLMMQQLTGTLTNLIPLRNHYAHTHFNLGNPYPPNLTSVPTPSVLKQFALTAENGLQALEAGLIANGC